MKSSAPVLPAREIVKLLSKKRHKFNATKTMLDGRSYHSAFEASVAAELEIRKKAGDIMHLTRQFEVPLIVGTVTVCKLIFDFRVIEKDGKVIFLEAKGAETAIYRLKMRLFRALYPQAVVRVIKKDGEVQR